MTLTLALSKGRLLRSAAEALGEAGFQRPDAESRRLIVEAGALRYLFVKDMDVPVYVEHGVADCGICGDDVLIENGGDVLVPLDLGFGRCRMVLAGQPGLHLAALSQASPRIATKYVRVATRFAEEQGLVADIVALSGSVEIAPALGLAHCVIDMVETGATLRDNGLVVWRELFATSARLVVNRASDHVKRGEIAALVAALGSRLAEKAK